MKKLLLAFVLLLTLLPVSNHAEAQSKINYLDKNTAKKILNGTFSYEGLKVGKKFSDYDHNKKYGFVNTYAALGDTNRLNKNRANSVYLNRNPIIENPFALADLQSKTSFSKKKINRLQIFVRDGYTLSYKKVKKVYGKPVYSTTGGAGCCSVKADIYKNATLYYYIPFTKEQTMKLAAVDVYKSKNKTELKKWKKFLEHNDINKTMK